MALRNRTRQYLELRSHVVRQDSAGGEGSDNPFLNEEGKGGGSAGSGREELPPEWVDIVDKIDSDIQAAEAKMRELSAKYEARLKVRFDGDTAGQDRDIEILQSAVARLFRQADRNLKRIATVGYAAGGQLPVQERVVRLNVMRSVGRRLQRVSKQYKAQHKQFTARKQNQEGAGDEFFGPGDGGGAEGLTDEQHAQMLQLDRRADQRQKEIDEIVDSIRQLNQMYNELSVLVVEQGTVLDRIDYNVEMTYENVTQANVELNQANDYSAKAAKTFWYCFFILLVMIIVLLGIVIHKYQK